MMNYKNFWKMTMVFGLLAALILPTANLANAKTNALKISPKLVGDRTDVLIKYGQLGAKYESDCNSLAEQERPSGERLKHCLTIAKELRDKFAEFNATLDTIVRNIKNGKKWTKELDEQFDRDAAKHKVKAETINSVRQAGGVRVFIPEKINLLKASKSEFDKEIKELEESIQKNDSAQNQVFQTVSYKRAAGHGRLIGRIKTLLARAVYGAIDVAITICDAVDC